MTHFTSGFFYSKQFASEDLFLFKNNFFEHHIEHKGADVMFVLPPKPTAHDRILKQSNLIRQKMTYFPLPLRQLLFLLSILPVFVQAQTATAEKPDCPDVAVQPILLVFSGSDWCQPCVRFEKQVLSDSTFQAYASEHLTVQKADFPQRRKLQATEIAENERLAAQYNPEGRFPHVVLLRPNRSVLAVLPHNADDGEQFVAQLKTYLPQ